MGLGTLTDRADGETILDTFFNEIHAVLNGSFVGRNGSGVATSGQELGTAAIPWGALRCASVIIGGTTIDTTKIVSPTNRVISGKTRSTSDQPAYIVPNGAALSFIVDASPTSLVFDVTGTAYTLSSDLTKSSLTAGASASHTCLVNMATVNDQFWTRTIGEEGSRFETLTVDTMGANMSSEIGKWCAFKMDNGSTTEVFMGFLKSSTEIIKCYRGFFYSSAIAPINRIFFANNDTITLLKLGWIFLESNLTTVDVTYNAPTYAFASPGSPVTGDYWYDLANNLWKRYDGATFQTVARTLIGMFVNDNTNCIAARATDFYGDYKNSMTFVGEVVSTEVIRSKYPALHVNVYGRDLPYGQASFPIWNITTDLATSADMYDATEQATRLYYLYLSNDGEEFISDIEPHHRAELYGWYHPHNTWRCVGHAYNNGSSNLVFVCSIPYAEGQTLETVSLSYNNGSPVSATNNAFTRMDFPTKIWNTHSGAVATGASWLFTAPCSGRYKVTSYLASASGGGWAAAEVWALAIIRNGAAGHKRLGTYRSETTHATAVQAWGCAIVDLNVLETCAVEVFQNSGGALDTVTGAEEAYIMIELEGSGIGSDQNNSG